MMNSNQNFVVAAVFLLFVSYVASDTTEPFTRFEYKLSFKGPFLTQKDGTIPFWEYGGHAIAGDSYIRLTPSMTDKKGHAWTKKVGDFANFRLDIALRVTGVGRYGGDGVGIWFVEEKPDYNLDKVEVFGGRNNWSGLAVLMDTYDNDGKRDNPKIAGFVSANKQLAWDHATDGLGQDVGHCLRDYRNRPFPVRLRVRYFHKRLTLSVNNGVATEDNDADYEPCFDKEGIELPAKGYFGITAATGGVSDDMDVYSFIVHSLADKGATAGSGAAEKANEADRLKYEQEYEEYSKKLRDQVEAIAKSHRESAEGHPHKSATGSDGAAGAAGGPTEDEAARQYRQIWEEQSRIRAAVHEVSAAVASSRQDMATGLTDLTHSVDAAKRELTALKTAGPPAAGGSLGPDATQGIRDLRDSLSRLGDKIDQLAGRHTELSERVDRSVKQKQQDRPPQAAAASDAPVCATTYGLYCALLLQTVALTCLGLVYLRKQNAAKKFY